MCRRYAAVLKPRQGPGGPWARMRELGCVFFRPSPLDAGTITFAEPLCFPGAGFLEAGNAAGAVAGPAPRAGRMGWPAALSAGGSPAGSIPLQGGWLPKGPLLLCCCCCLSTCRPFGCVNARSGEPAVTPISPGNLILTNERGNQAPGALAPGPEAPGTPWTCQGAAVAVQQHQTHAAH